MKIKFLGTGHGVPTNDRYCSSVVLETNGSIYLIDAGAPVIDIMERWGMDYNAVKGIFITHCHGDHYSGLISFLDLANWYHHGISPDVFIPEQKLIDVTYDILEGMEGNIVDRNRLRLKVAPEGFVYQDENIKVTSYHTSHLERAGRPSFAYHIEVEGKKVIFTGDFNNYEDFERIAGSFESDVIISEFSHPSVDDITKGLENLSTKQIWFTHVYDFFKFDVIDEMNGKYPFSVHTANDNDEIIL